MNSVESALQSRAERGAEQKFRVHGLFQLPDLETFDGVAAVVDRGIVDLESAYFDTADLRLAREGITLRRRRGDDEGWHLKLPAGASASGVRDEIRLPLAADQDRAPEQLIDIVRVIVRTSPVAHVSTLRTHRRVFELRDPSDRPIAELVDDTVHVVGGDGTVTARFRELELEERAGGEALTGVADALTGAGAVGGEFVAKVVRALGPAASGPPEIPSPMTTASAERGAPWLATDARELRAADLACRRSSGPLAADVVDRLHDAADRLHTHIKNQLPDLLEFLSADRSQALYGEVTWLIEELGAARTGVGASRQTGTSVLDVLDMARYLALHEALIAAAAAEHQHVTTA